MEAQGPGIGPLFVAFSIHPTAAGKKIIAEKKKYYDLEP
jgi:hypothetical protein